MRKISLTLPTLALLTMGCGHELMQPQVASDREIVAVKAERDEPVELIKSAGDPEARFSEEPQVGDFVVFRFSGSYRPQPLVLTQRVVAIPKPGELVMDVELDDGESTVRLRLRLHHVSGARGELASVARLDDSGKLLPFGVAAYEQLMAQTMLDVDSNDRRLGSSVVTVPVGEQSLPAVKTTYRVSVSGGAATLETYESKRFLWGDVGGRIVAADGTVLYRAEVLKVGDGRDLSKARQIAIQAGHEGPDDDYE